MLAQYMRKYSEYVDLNGAEAISQPKDNFGNRLFQWTEVRTGIKFR